MQCQMHLMKRRLPPIACLVNFFGNGKIIFILLLSTIIYILANNKKLMPSNFFFYNDVKLVDDEQFKMVY